MLAYWNSFSTVVKLAIVGLGMAVLVSVTVAITVSIKTENIPAQTNEPQKVITYDKEKERKFWGGKADKVKEPDFTQY